MQNTPRFLQNLKRLRQFFKELNLEPVHLFLPSLLALAASIFEGITFSLLVPTIRGLMEANFSFVDSIKVIGSFTRFFPEIFYNRNSAIFAFLISLIVLSAISKNIFAYVSSVLVSNQVRRLSHEIRRIIFNSYMDFNKAFFDSNSTGHLQNILIGYTEQIANQFRSLHAALFGIFSLIVYLVVMATMSWKVTLFALVVFPIMFFSFQKLIVTIRQESKKFSEAFSLLGKKISNALSCVLLVKASCSEDREKKWFAHISEEVRRAQLKIDHRTLLIAPVQEVFLLIMLIVLVGFMAYLIVHEKEGRLSSYLVFFVILRRAMSSMGSITAIQGSIASVMGPLKEVMTVVETRNQHQEKTGVLPLLSFKNKIEFKNLTFSYLDREVLQKISFEIQKGQMVAIIGRTGSGKSTLAQLLMRFYDSPRGAILIDGQDIGDFQTSALRRKIAYISQESYFFDTSIEINLKYGCLHELSEAEVDSALEKAQLKDLIAKLPHGIKTKIGERGVQLSGGEKQRLSLARAILKNPEILILDEATSAMDSQTEKLVQASIAEAAKGRTSIVIAHRLTTIQKADVILVLEHGRLVERGSFAELMKANSSYFKVFWNSQSTDETN